MNYQHGQREIIELTWSLGVVCITKNISIISSSAHASTIMKFYIILLGFVLLAQGVKAKNVFNFEVRKENNITQRRPKLTTFSWKDCSDLSSAVMVVKNLDVTPDPIVTPGALFVAIELMVKKDVSAPIEADLLLYKKVDDMWVKFPCLGILGSCHYDDLCQVLDLISSCPDPIVESGIGCQCPFKAGTYTMPKSEFDIDAAAVAAGDYHAVGNATLMGKPAFCLDLYLSFSE
ncbi:hypothetical protein CHS0354_028026 [Potamilus streckersoni]|uniref:MD-2-related lipid-recognition domain-containing protein n=1 Tax=Potamilus streckersoni TaxID=2493646 RepID=A0AAE0TI52_9BIVA|nr:hypothetical protein CHS0354_028026 [Potamilus streckersoni]